MMQHRSVFLWQRFSAVRPRWCVATLALAPCARADQVAYLVNVTVRPGYNFPNAQAALDYGYGICDKVSAWPRLTRRSWAM